MSDTLILASVFVAVLLVAFTTISIIANRREMKRNIDELGADRIRRNVDEELALSSDNDDIRHYYEVQAKGDPNSLAMRLIRAGYFSREAIRVFVLIRVLVTILVFVAVWFALVNVGSGVSGPLALLLAAAVAGISFILVNAVLDNMGKSNQIRYRRLFPDFMDLLIVCVDSGMSIEAAIDRVAREFLPTRPGFGRHLSIISLEIRAGRPLHEALNNFSQRLNLEEARTLAVLFRQSQELGTSVVKTLRVFSAEMRQMRLIKAEEKANALPVKMLFPMALFLFPVNLVIVLVPVMIALLKMFTTMSPGGG
ncbi:type II secretion system F family protein [Aliigemmobacter aestuarii]|uniref:Type II secretion system F family protein n=1 Tax=Aliigemmobacter aestuarii TaxID=1445661 RepID=A0A4S3MKS8_9RHOB|nr:type II secretion system F family protein [Gemmobacter aestuarii]THD82445.1 type II secretion system F family protein [Gemmobacter aestuarii]